MYVCICKSVTEDRIRQAAADGVRDFSELQALTGCSTGCGCCEREAHQILAEATPARHLDLLVVAVAVAA